MTQKIPFCDGVHRRNLLRIGMAGMIGGGLTLPAMLQQQALAADRGRESPRRDVALIIIFLHGGLSTIDTLDMKSEAPQEFRGEFHPIDTNVPGIRICEHLPRMAAEADKYALLRNLTHSNSSHGHADHYMLTGYHPRAGFNPSLKPNNQFPALGSIISRKLGPQGGVPPYVCLPQMHNSCGAAYLGSTAAPFVVEADPNSPNFSVPDLVPPLVVDADRLHSRQELLQRIDRFQWSAESRANQNAQAVGVYQQKAFDLITSSATQRAFDIDQESQACRDRYGRHTLGQSCLMARRLVEAGVRCVTVDHNNWDTHYNNFHVLKNDLLPHLDSAIAALVRDLAERSLLKSTLVCVMGEFGRTPRVNKDAGRDHWGPANTILLAGGGIRGGQVVGATNSRGEKPAGNPVGPEDLAATLFDRIGIDSDEEFRTPEGRPIKIVNNGRVLSELF